MNRLYYAADSTDEARAAMLISPDTIAKALRGIYNGGKGKDGAYISPALFNAITDLLRKAEREGLDSSSAPDPDDDFRQALSHADDVFAAFKVHRMQRDMGRMLTDEDGELKPFTQWMRDVLPIASHQCGAWLRTEYDTAVLRAHQAADWQQYEREKDMLPNLKWMPSTSINPGTDHMPFWNTVRPIDDPFWDEHRPGDRWNCKCSLTSTDEPVTATPQAGKESDPQPGLSSNPGKERAAFSQDHPYFPKSCGSCSFHKPKLKDWLRTLFHAQAKDCYNCPYINGCIERMSSNGFKLAQNLKNGGKLYVHPNVDKDKGDYKDMKRICQQFAQMGKVVKMTPRLHVKSEEYSMTYRSLLGTKYEGKCPDFSVDGVFYEYEGFSRPWKKKKVGRMLSHGLAQSPRVVINNTKGCSDRFIRKAVMARLHLPGQDLKEVWIYEKGSIRLFYKDGRFSCK